MARPIDLISKIDEKGVFNLVFFLAMPNKRFICSCEFFGGFIFHIEIGRIKTRSEIWSLRMNALLRLLHRPGICNDDNLGAISQRSQ